MKTSTSLPETVEYKSNTATIYRHKHRGSERFEVRYYDLDGSLQRSTFATYKAASAFANVVVEELAKNRSQFVALRGTEAYEYQAAKAQLKQVGLSMPEIVTMVAENLKVLGSSASIPEAIRYFVDNRPQHSPGITVKEVVDQLISIKQKEGEVSKLYLRDLRVRLQKFANAFACPISKVTPPAIRDYLLNLKVSNRTRHNLRTTLVTLFNFAKVEGYLPADHKGVPRPTKRSRTKLAVQIFTSDELTQLLAHAEDDAITVALCIQGFAGIRAEELKRLWWHHIDLNEGHIVVPDTVAKCQERRIVPISENLKAWLRPHARATGPVCPFTNLANVYNHLAHRAKVEWKRNGLRHSFISYRTALIKNVPQVAFEAGNSPAMIYRNYLKAVTEAAAKKWFGVMPDQPANVEPLPTACAGPQKLEAIG